MAVPVGGTDLFTAVGRNLKTFLAPILLLAAIGVGLGLVRHAQYTAETRVSIGQLNVTTQGIPGFMVAAENLSAAYARSVTAAQVIKGAARRAHVSGPRARAALSASAIPSTPLFRIEAVDTDRRVAIRLANGATHALIKHVADVNRRANIRANLLKRYRKAAAKVTTLGRRAALVGTGPGSAALGAKVQQAILKRNTLASLYASASSGEVTQNLLQVLVRATSASSDRSTVAERWGLIGALVGLLLGLPLAARREAVARRPVPATA